MTRLLPVVLALLLVGCAETTTPSQPAPAPTQSQATEAEAFAPFFERFRTDLAFQRERRAPDFSYRYLDDDPDGFGLMEVEGTWEPHRLGWEGGERVEERFNEQDSPEAVAPDADAVTFHIAGLDSGVSVVYRFERRDGRWLFVEMVDQST